MKQLAIIGSTASGKSDLALELAGRFDALILSIDSLSIYRDIDIASAKPSKQELASIRHFGIDAVSPSEHVNVFTFVDEYRNASAAAKAEGKNLIIVGGSSFYLKSMLEGLSSIPEYSEKTIEHASAMLEDLSEAHRYLTQIDPLGMEKIQPSDPYRIEKMLLLHLETGLPPSEWFRAHPPQPLVEECPVLELRIERNVLRRRIVLRTEKMIASGLIDEVAELERCYGRSPNSMKAIGIIETLRYLDAKIDKSQLREEIATHTAQLAKRQQTFNTNQFECVESGDIETLRGAAENLLR